jgi:hypothetical protein
MNSKILMVIVVIVVAGGSFFGGMQYQKSKVSSFAGGQGGAFRQRMGQGQSAAFRPVRGDILSIDSNTMTVKLQDGSTKIVILSGSTTYMKEAPSTVDDLKAGITVMVTGTNNSDGSVIAQSVQSGNLPTPKTPAQGAAQ